MDWIWRFVGAKLTQKPQEVSELLHKENWDEKILEKTKIVDSIKAEISKNERAIKRISAAIIAEEDEDFDATSYRLQRRQITADIKYLKQELDEATQKLGSIIQLRDDQEKLAQLLTDKELRLEISAKLAQLTFGQQQRLIEGLLAEPIEIRPAPWDDPTTLDQRTYQYKVVQNSYPIFRYNEPILQDILGLDKQLEKSRSRRISTCGRSKTAHF